MARKQALDDLGEWRLLRGHVWKRFHDIQSSDFPLGSDCGGFWLADGRALVCTVDAAPTPLSWEILGHDHETLGWYALLPSISDLAASGATAVGCLLAIDAPGDFLVSDFDAILGGFREAAREFEIMILGGDIRRRRHLSLHTTLLGTTDSGRPLDRRSARPGDAVGVVGSMGVFAAVATFVRNGSTISGMSRSDAISVLTRPRPPVKAMRILRSRGLLRASIDNSDGLLISLALLGTQSRVSLTIDCDAVTKSLEPVVRAAVRRWNVSPLTLATMWGDWNQIVTMSPEAWHEAAAVCETEGVRLTRIGRVVGPKKRPGELASSEGRLIAPRGNENFRPGTFNSLTPLRAFDAALAGDIWCQE